jgi:hypothetical protein
LSATLGGAFGFFAGIRDAVFAAQAFGVMCLPLRWHPWECLNFCVQGS